MQDRNQWHFGMWAHMGANGETGIAHGISTTAANVREVTVAQNLLHGGEAVAWGDAGYQGVGMIRPSEIDPGLMLGF